MQMLTKIIYKNFRSNFKNYVAFFIGNMMGVTEFFVFWGLYSIVKNMSANSVMLEDTLEEIIISVSVITIFSTALMVYSMLNYIKKRIADYSLFYILGMKKQKLYVFVFSEYLAGWMVSLLIGLGIGRGILYLIQQIWHKLFPTYISLCSVGTEIYFNTCKISFFIMLAVVFVLLIWADNSGISRMIAGNEIKEKRPKSIYWSICIVIGGGLLILGYWSYPSNTFTGYVLSHVEWIMGGFLILIFGGGILLEIIHSHLKFYLKNLLKLNQLYSKYQTNVLVLLMFFSLHFIALSYCTANVCELLPINGHEKYYPYQAIWMNRGEKGDISFSETLSHSYNGKYENIPMIRVSSYGNELIGISENTYKKLTGKSADLKNEEIIYIVNEYKNHSGANVTRGGFEYGRNGFTWLASNHNRASKNTLLFCLIGVAVFILTLVSIVTYWGQIGYTIPTALGIITAIIFTLFGCRLYLEKLRKRKNKYYKKILWLDNWYDQFFSHANISYIVSAFLIVILFGFNIVLVDNLPVRQPENYPYDIVWGANTKDKAFIEKLKEKYNVQTEFIPSIRVTSGNCAEHTGISATEYKRLTGKQVHLKNDEIYVVYQCDRSEYGTIGLDFGKLKPRLYTGCATADIWIYSARTLPGNKFTRKYTIKGNDRRIITGNFKTRVLSTSNMNTDVFEDIIVFSDHEYDKISQKAKGSNLTVLMNVVQNYDAVVNKIANYAAKHSQINFFDYHDGNLIYDKKPCTIENQENRMLNVSAMLIDMLVLFISIIFILLEKISSDYEALEWKYLFYYRTGMPEKKRRKNIYKEITMTSKVALITGMFIAAVMILVKILYKKMPVYWTKIYLAEAAVMIIGVTAFIMIIVRIAAWRSFKHSERRNKDE